MRVAILISRQARGLTARTWWLRAVWEAAGWMGERGIALVTAEHVLPQRFAAWAMRERGGAVERVDAAGMARAEVDRAVCDRADLLVAIAVRGGGGMEATALDAIARKKLLVVHGPLDDRGLAGNRRLIAAGAERLDLAIEIPVPRPVALPLEPTPSPDGFLWHCTRSRSGPWPGQSEDDYFRSLIRNDPGSSHTADDALDRILAERKIRACGKMIRGRCPVVCFSAARPESLLEARRYKPALLRWDFEPAAIGIRREVAEARGVRPVRYLSPEAFADLAPEERPFFQKHAPPEVDYSHEEEWRCEGDFPLDGIAEKDLFVWRS